MLKKRIIPTLLLKNNRMVKGKEFKNYRDVGDPISAVRIYNSQHADEIIFIDINENKDFNYLRNTLEKVSENCFIPLCAGGGINSLNQIKELLRAGADKVLITSEIYKNKNFLKQAAKRFGSQCIVAGFDIKLGLDNKYLPSINSGNQIIKDYDLTNYLKFLEKNGAGEILINFIDKDGLMKGTNIEVLKVLSNTTDIPIIVLGGIGNFQHAVDVFKETKTTAVACGSIFHFGSNDPIRFKSYLKNYGIDQRDLR